MILLNITLIAMNKETKVGLQLPQVSHIEIEGGLTLPLSFALNMAHGFSSCYPYCTFVPSVTSDMMLQISCHLHGDDIFNLVLTL